MKTSLILLTVVLSGCTYYHATIQETAPGQTDTEVWGRGTYTEKLADGRQVTVDTSQNNLLDAAKAGGVYILRALSGALHGTKAAVTGED